MASFPGSDIWVRSLRLPPLIRTDQMREPQAIRGLSKNGDSPFKIPVEMLSILMVARPGRRGPQPVATERTVNAACPIAYNGPDSAHRDAKCGAWEQKGK